MSHVFAVKTPCFDGLALVEAANRPRAIRYLAAHATAEVIEGGELVKAMQHGARFFDATQEADTPAPADDAAPAAGNKPAPALATDPDGFLMSEEVGA